VATVVGEDGVYADLGTRHSLKMECMPLRGFAIPLLVAGICHDT
jgi:hypothetical protein